MKTPIKPPLNKIFLSLINITKTEKSKLLMFRLKNK
jgi:hypothetical protein